MKLSELQIKHFGCIGDDGITVKIDDIVVLIGKNNVGKTTILRAYEAFSSAGSALSLDSFYRNDVSLPIEIVGVFTDIGEDDKDLIGSKWIYSDAGKDVIKYRWIWEEPDRKGSKSSWDNEAGKWRANGVGGWDSKVTSCIPVPLVVNPFEDSAKMERQIVDLLTASVSEKVKSSDIVDSINAMANDVKDDVVSELKDTTDKLQDNLGAIFPGCTVSVEPHVEKIDLDKMIAGGTCLHVAYDDNEQYPLSCQGSGLQRAFLWSAIEALADSDRMKNGRSVVDSSKQKILLVEEPESFLHPPAIRAARDALYKIAELRNWQVMMTTHSPILIDVSKPHTTIVRVESEQQGTKVFSTDEATFTEDERQRLKMIRSCHPTVNEFFFADKVVLVEGDTEEVAFSKVAQDNVTVLNCKGKANIPMFERILNHFGISYIVLHDLDKPKACRGGKYVRNSAWSVNMQILSESQRGVGNRVFVNVPDFEGQFFGYLQDGDKPYNAFCELEKPENADALHELANVISGDAGTLSDRLVSTEEQYVQFGIAYCEENSIPQSGEWDFAVVQPKSI